MIYAANFKTNHTRSSTKEYIASLNTLIKDSSHQVFVFPPATALDSYESVATIGAQNAHFTQMEHLPER
jgi:triosephosphate isomerase